MRKNRGKILVIVLVLLSIICMGSVYAHPGRTDSSGGHRDNRNKSGLGSYHYHCGGHSAHLHKNGVCLYSSSPKKSSTTSKTSSKKKTSTVKASSIQINKRISELEVGEDI